MAALQLGDFVLTCLPVPPRGETRAALGEAVAHSPRYRRVLEAWARLAPLWSSSLLGSLAQGSNASDDPWPCVVDAARRLETEPSWSSLRGFARAEAFVPSDETLDALCADLLKGGPDPGLAIPVTSGLDAFAGRHGLMAVRSIGSGRGGAGRVGAVPGTSASLAQQAEARLGRAVLSVGVPILLQASARTIQRTRELLDGPRQTLAGTLAGTPSGSEDRRAGSAVRAAAADYTRAFRERVGPLLGRDDDERTRVVEGFVSLQLREVPLDAVMLAAVMAMGRAPAAGASGAGSGWPLRTLTVTAMPVTLGPIALGPH
jgi:hypothetical protein